MSTWLNTAAKAAVAAAGLLAATTAIAQDYPTKQVNLVIPFSPGGTNDTVGRFMADGLSKLWGQTVVVENRPGAGGVIGTALVTKAQPDGYTLLLISGSLTTNAAVQPSLPFDPVADLQPIAMASDGDMVVLAGAGVATTLDELKAAAGAQQLFYGTPGLGTIAHLASELLSDAQGIEMTPVHYQGGTEVITDLGGGRIGVYVCGINDALKGVGTPLAIMSETRSVAFPDVPSTAELGLTDAFAKIWLGVFGPAGLPLDLAEKINRDIVSVMSTPEAVAFLQLQGAAPSAMTPAELTDYVGAELAKWADLAQRHDIKAQ